LIATPESDTPTQRPRVSWDSRFISHRARLIAAITMTVFDEGGRPAAPASETRSGSAPPPSVLGTTDDSLHIDRISPDVSSFIGWQPEEAIGKSVLFLVVPEDGPAVLSALAHGVTTHGATSVYVRARRNVGEPLPCQMLVVPLVPAPTFAFAMVASDAGEPVHLEAGDLTEVLGRLGQVLPVVAPAGDVDPGELRPDALARLSSRELEIVTMLLAGDRVPAIAESLHLTQSTVRNHLSSVFQKLRVSSQQALIVLLRKTDGDSVRHDDEPSAP
jgi:PAS domain S-box-containing protein